MDLSPKHDVENREDKENLSYTNTKFKSGQIWGNICTDGFLKAKDNYNSQDMEAT